jgi:hypothetical protein
MDIKEDWYNEMIIDHHKIIIEQGSLHPDLNFFFLLLFPLTYAAKDPTLLQ